MKKVQLSLNEDLVAKADKYADENYLTRSAFFTLAAKQFLNSNDVSQAICDLAISMRRIADTNEIDETTKSQLKQFEVLAQLLGARR